MYRVINVINQKMFISSTTESLVAGSQKFVKFIFNLSSDWDELTVFAQFTQNGVAYNQYLDSENSVYLPPEIKAGTCTLMLYGSKDKVIGTTNYLTFTVDENILIKNAKSIEITQSLYDQLVDKVDNFLTQKDTTLTAKLEETVTEELLGYIDDGKLANLVIGDGTIERDKVDADFEATLVKADNSASTSDLTAAVRNAVMFADENNTMQFKLDSDGGVKLIITEREAE